jgi:predicted metalloprotease with PDZ domain
MPDSFQRLMDSQVAAGHSAVCQRAEEASGHHAVLLEEVPKRCMPTVYAHKLEGHVAADDARTVVGDVRGEV